ncbi:MAG: response regulator transcription factor [Thermoguttaceae bacterium]
MIAENHYVHPVRNDGFVAELYRSRSALLAAESAEIDDVVFAQPPTVFVVDPDPVTGTMVRDLLHGHELAVEEYASGRKFFAAYAGGRPGCVVLEQRIFDMSGLQIQRRLAEQDQRLPMVFVASGLDVSTAVVLMRGGAIHILEKPLSKSELLKAIQQAVAIDRNVRRKEAGRRRVKESIARLTCKERQLLSLIAAAKSPKAISAELEISPRSVDLRRRGVMDKLGMKSSLELLKFAVLAWQECSYFLDSPQAQSVADCG